MTQPSDLFEDIAAMLMCDYLSDLKSAPYLPSVKRLMKHLDLEPYPLHQLSDMAQYLYDRSQPFRDQEEALRFFRLQ